MNINYKIPCFNSQIFVLPTVNIPQFYMQQTFICLSTYNVTCLPPTHIVQRDIHDMENILAKPGHMVSKKE